MNIVVINPDQMRWDYCSHAGHPFIDTRHLSRLAAMGTVFSHAFISCPMCSPSRTSFVTGTYAIEHGVRDYGPSFDPRKPNALVNLGAAGFRRGIYGKDHIINEDQRRFRAIGKFYDEGENICLGNLSEHPDNRFSYSSGPLAEDSPWNLTGRLTTAAIEFIRRQARARRKFFVTINYQDPHPYFTCPEPYASLFSPDMFTLPPNFRHDADPREPIRLTLWREHSQHRRASDFEKRRLMAFYCGQIRYVDDQVGRLLDVLEELRLLQDTIVLFWSDHGEYLNDFGVTHKQATFYECLVRVPIVLYEPTGRVKRGTCQDLVEAMDIMATVLDLARVPQPEGSRAWSLVRADYTPRADVFADGGLYRVPPRAPVPNLRLRAAHPPTAYGPGAMLRTATHKLCVSAVDRTELYDLQSDPFEMHNLAGEPDQAGLQAALTNRLMSRLLTLGQAPEHMPRWGVEVFSH
jgi:arylsulfatase A-like enzyme